VITLEIQKNESSTLIIFKMQKNVTKFSSIQTC